MNTINSYGIICVKIEKRCDNKIVKLAPIIRDNPYIYYDLTPEIDRLINMVFRIEYLFVMRRHTYSYAELIMGQYKTDDKEHMKKMASLMTNEEIARINSESFDKIWNEYWNTTDLQTDLKRKKNYNKSLNKFGIFRNKMIKELNNRRSKWDCPEWGFPKGRKNSNESNMDCAKREFMEETNMDKSDFRIINIRSPIEKYVSSNSKRYKHKYYHAEALRNICLSIDKTNVYQKYEIGNIGWYTFKEGLELIRDYHVEKMRLFKFTDKKVKLILGKYLNLFDDYPYNCELINDDQYQ